ncbi:MULTISPECIES: hypothetical protein [Clostridium]|uniref:Bacteriophage HK97-gp10, tail-component n=1 Tax=Clostridium frigoriphilum TaxID=443253 RepID=A0ABU7UVX4_9CLOT|nr:hypothetical protein [Clostridium sp. DSM 17811]MBU3098742.1 hypothetical protein [Clostridium sp. DSM 17811]
MSSSGFEGFIKDLGNIVNNYESDSKEFMLKIEKEVIADTQLNTPVLSGDLKRSFTFDEPIKEGNSIVGVVGADIGVPYAEAVENGHSNENGGFIQGQFMLKKATEKIKFEEKVEDFYKKLAKKVGL